MPSIQTEVQVRPGIEGDLVALTDICNQYVRETALTFDTAPFHPNGGCRCFVPAAKTARTIFWLLRMSAPRRAGSAGTYWDVARYEQRLGPES